MQIETSRFGSVEIEANDILLLPMGLIGFEDQLHWVLLADEDNRSVGWLQSIGDPELAVAVVSPRQHFPEYRIRLSRNQLATLQLADMDQAYVLNILSENDHVLTANLRAPLLINLDKRIGRQIISSDEQSLQVPLEFPPTQLRRSA